MGSVNPDNVVPALLFLAAAVIGGVAVFLGFRLVRDIRSTQRELARIEEERTK